MRNRELTDEFAGELILRAAAAWETFTQSNQGFQRFIPADYPGALMELRRLKEGADTFLELGSGVGLITVMADLLGYDSYGIEIHPALMDESLKLADFGRSRATFAEGSFVPVDYRDQVDLLSGDFLTVTEGADAYEEIGMQLPDFDLVYAYPWPGEEDWLHELIRAHAGPSTQLMTYSVSEGFQLSRPCAED
ncbi:MAG: SAM-dependent methyltransferase [Planctomycetota bacterium]|jgi:SAM-dependent methyltransferase